MNFNNEYVTVKLWKMGIEKTAVEDFGKGQRGERPRGKRRRLHIYIYIYIHIPFYIQLYYKFSVNKRSYSWR